MTALAMAARGNAPVVVFAGDAPIGASWCIQSIDQAPLALATGAHFVPIRTIDRALDCVREASYVARAERKPVVLSVPLDLQTEEFPYLPDYTPLTELMPRVQVLRPDPAVVDEIVGMVAEAERPVVLGGRDAMWSGAKGALETLAQESGALLATTLLGKGLFDGNPFALDIAGTFATDLGWGTACSCLAREVKETRSGAAGHADCRIDPCGSGCGGVVCRSPPHRRASRQRASAASASRARSSKLRPLAA